MVSRPPCFFLNNRKRSGKLYKGWGAERGARFVLLHSSEYLKPFRNVVLAQMPGKSWWHQGLAWGARGLGRAWSSLLGASRRGRRRGERSVPCWGPNVQEPHESSCHFLFSLCTQLRVIQNGKEAWGWVERCKAKFQAASEALLSPESVLFWPGLHLSGNAHQS